MCCYQKMVDDKTCANAPDFKRFVVDKPPWCLKYSVSSFDIEMSATRLMLCPVANGHADRKGTTVENLYIHSSKAAKSSTTVNGDFDQICTALHLVSVEEYMRCCRVKNWEPCVGHGARCKFHIVSK